MLRSDALRVDYLCRIVLSPYNPNKNGTLFPAWVQKPESFSRLPLLQGFFPVVGREHGVDDDATCFFRSLCSRRVFPEQARLVAAVFRTSGDPFYFWCWTFFYSVAVWTFLGLQLLGLASGARVGIFCLVDGCLCACGSLVDLWTCLSGSLLESHSGQCSGI